MICKKQLSGLSFCFDKFQENIHFFFKNEKVPHYKTLLQSYIAGLSRKQPSNLMSLIWNF